MNGAADLGGMMGFGPVVPEPEGEPFHADWERRALALTLAIGAAGRWSIDASRHARESLPPAQYLSWSYFRIWVAALERLLVAHGLVGADELAAGRALRAGEPVPVLAVESVEATLSARKPYDRPVESEPRWRAGDRVRARNIHPAGHTRLPRYARGHVGVVDRVHGAHVLPDASAHGAGEQPQWLYSVRFTGRELWGDAAEPRLDVTIDAWQSYLEPI